MQLQLLFSILLLCASTVIGMSFPQLFFIRFFIFSLRRRTTKSYYRWNCYITWRFSVCLLVYYLLRYFTLEFTSYFKQFLIFLFISYVASVAFDGVHICGAIIYNKDWVGMLYTNLIQIYK